MSFRRKLLLVFALTVTLSIGAVVWVISTMTRRTFEQADEERTTALVAQFRREFQRRGEDVARRIEAIAASDATTRIALALSRGSALSGEYLSEARSVADTQQLDFLEFVDSDGNIVSSAQWPAKVGYHDDAMAGLEPLPTQAFLQQEQLPEGAALGLVAARKVTVGDKPLYVIGGRRVDKDFLASLELPSGMRAMFYQNVASGFSPDLLIDPASTVRQPELLAPLIQQVQQQRQEVSATIHWPKDAGGDEAVHAIPLDGPDRQLLGILLVGNSRRSYIELRQKIRSAALLVGGASIVMAILLSSWAAARVTRPVERLAEAAREVAAGNWNTQVAVNSNDELGELATSFNRMTGQLQDQTDRLVRAERVAAWRELARRLAHELKNPLFPLQLTVENLVRARQQTPEQFDEVFRESSATLLAEIANLKTIVGRFSEFSRMPQPQLQRVQVNEIVQNVARLFQAQTPASGKKPVTFLVKLAPSMEEIAADPELLHRALSNLVLNAMDAMPEGGDLTLQTHQSGDQTTIQVSDTGAGLTQEECERLFTPYYTTKSKGTGLGLAIVQSVISDHGGKIAVRSGLGLGTIFAISLPRNLDRLPTPDSPDLRRT